MKSHPLGPPPLPRKKNFSTAHLPPPLAGHASPLPRPMPTSPVVEQQSAAAAMPMRLPAWGSRFTQWPNHLLHKVTESHQGGCRMSVATPWAVDLVWSASLRDDPLVSSSPSSCTLLSLSLFHLVTSQVQHQAKI